MLEVIKARIDQIAAWGYDWVDFGSMDWIIDEYYVATPDVRRIVNLPDSSVIYQPMPIAFLFGDDQHWELT